MTQRPLEFVSIAGSFRPRKLDHSTESRPSGREIVQFIVNKSVSEPRHHLTSDGPHTVGSRDHSITAESPEMRAIVRRFGSNAATRSMDAVAKRSPLGASTTVDEGPSEQTSWLVNAASSSTSLLRVASTGSMLTPIMRALPFFALVSMIACRSNDQQAGRGANETALASCRDAARCAWTVTPTGVGPVRFGSSLAQLNAALGDTLRPKYDVNDECDHLQPAAFPMGMSLMIERDTIVRVDVDTAGIRTREGAQVGDTEQDVLALYGSRVEVQPHKYTGPEGHYLVIRDPADTLRLLIFETDGHRVERYRAGLRPAVEYIEGCL